MCIRDRDTVLSYRDFPLETTDISIFFSGFISWIAEYCMQHEIKKLYFFTREGEFYKQLFDIWKDNSRFKQKLPETWILEVSRIATFLPSIREVSINAGSYTHLDVYKRQYVGCIFERD